MPGIAWQSPHEPKPDPTGQPENKQRRAPDQFAEKTVSYQAFASGDAAFAARLLVTPDLLVTMRAVTLRPRPGNTSRDGNWHHNGRRSSANRSPNDRFNLRPHFIAAEVAPLGRAHFRHGGIRFRVVVVSIPEQETVPTLLFRCLDLDFNILRRVSLGAPRKSLQPGTNDHPTTFGDQREPFHGLANKMLRRVARVRNAVHAKEVRRINHGREHVTVLRHRHNVLPRVR